MTRLSPHSLISAPTDSASRRRRFALATVWFLAVLLFTQACTVKLIADYDEQVDQSLMSLQRSFTGFFLSLDEAVGTPAAAYDNYQDFYRQAKVDAAALKFRVDSQPLNDISSDAVSLLIDNIDLLEEIHKEGIDDLEVVTVIRDDFMTSLSSLLRLELAKQRGNL